MNTEIAPDTVSLVNLRPGELYASRDPVWIRTVLGSCVAVCLYDPIAGVGGMNHFMLPGSRRHTGEVPARYGVHAMELLIEGITVLGGVRSRLVAKAFGGGNVLRMGAAAPTVAQNNVGFIREFLDQAEIPMLSCKLGGHAALGVRFFTANARTLVRPLKSRRARTWLLEELNHGLSGS